MKEIWKPISYNMYYVTGLINRNYEVSNLGRIRNAKTGKIIKGYPTQSSQKLRWTMHTEDNYMTLQFLVDKTVYITFTEDRSTYGRPIKHKDGNPLNNALDNLYV